MSKTTAFGSVTETKLNDIYKKEPHIYKVQTNWYAGDIYVQYDYDYVLTTLTRDQLAYYLVRDYNLPVWSIVINKKSNRFNLLLFIRINHYFYVFYEKHPQDLNQ